MCGRCLREGTEHYDFSAKPKRKKKAVNVFSAYVPTDEDLAELAAGDEAAVTASQVNPDNEASVEPYTFVSDHVDVAIQEDPTILSARPKRKKKTVKVFSAYVPTEEDLAAELAAGNEAAAAASQTVSPDNEASLQLYTSASDHGDVANQKVDDPTTGNFLFGEVEWINSGTVDANEVTAALPMYGMDTILSTREATAVLEVTQEMATADDNTVAQAVDSPTPEEDNAVVHEDRLSQDKEQVDQLHSEQAVTNTAEFAVVGKTSDVGVTTADATRMSVHQQTGTDQIDTISELSAHDEPTDEEPRKLGRLQWAVVYGVQALFHAVGYSS